MKTETESTREDRAKAFVYARGQSAFGQEVWEVFADFAAWEVEIALKEKDTEIAELREALELHRGLRLKEVK